MGTNDIRNRDGLKQNIDEVINTPAPDAAPNPEEAEAKRLADLKLKPITELNGDEQAFIADHADELSDEERLKYGLVDSIEVDVEKRVGEIMTKDPSLMTEEEKQFVADNQSMLTEDQKKAMGLDTPEPTKPKPAVVVPENPPIKTPEEQLKEQRREAQILDNWNEKMLGTIEEANNLPEPSADELKAELAKKIPGTTWEDLTLIEQQMFKENYVNSRRMGMISKLGAERKEIQAWADNVDKFIHDEDLGGFQNYKKLSSHEDEFRKFCMMKSHRGVDINILAKAFLSDLPAPTRPANGSLFPVGGGQAPAKPKDGIIRDADEAKRIKTTDPRQYARLIREKKIQIEV